MGKRNSSDDGRKDSGKRGRPGRSQRSTSGPGKASSKFPGRKKDSGGDFSSPRKRSFSSDDKPSSTGKKPYGSKPGSRDGKGSDFHSKKSTFNRGEKRSSSSSGKFSRNRSESGSSDKGEGRFPMDRREGSRGGKTSDFPAKRSSFTRGEKRTSSSSGKFTRSKGEGFSRSSDKKEGRFSKDRREDSRGGKGSDFPAKKSSFSRGEKKSSPSGGKFSKERTDRFSGSSEKKGEGRFPMDRKAGSRPPSDKKPFKKSFDGPEANPKKFAAEDRPKRKSYEKSGEGEKYSVVTPVQTEQIRLNRYIANSGVCSRREADELITMGLISVNGKTITEMGYKVNPGDEVRYESRVLRAERPVYILLNKPKGFLTTTSDPQERNTVMHIIANAVKERVYPVGRLDRNTTGLLLLTNDGDLADKLMHPSYNVKKIYKVELDRPLNKADFDKLKAGIDLEEGKAMVDDIAIVSEDGKTVGVELHIGWNRVVRRLFESLDYQVVKLDRSVYAGLDKKDLPRGHWRFLRKEEIVRLKHYK
jgi:23S rRNA pseudouridine2605 synthase